MKYIVTTLTISALLLIGASCTGTDKTDTNTATKTKTDTTVTPTMTDEADTNSADIDAEVEVEATTSGTIIPFSEVGDNMLDAASSDMYSEFEFVNGTGTCVDQGLPEFSYIDDPDLGYFIVESKDKTYQETWASLSFTGYLSFSEVPLTDGPADCTAISEFEKDEATVTCSIEEEDICEATFEVNAITI
ncbi:MAG: hypothetical protein Q8P90_02515 [bacterium]|nr:hypothetical protein [bacterium]